MLTFLKLGGSLITDKKVERGFRRPVMTRLAAEIASALQESPDLRLLIGHGSGSFGHFAASRHKTIEGVHTPEEWRAFAEVATVAAELNYLVTDTLHKAGVPTWRIQPSASAISQNGEMIEMNVLPIQRALEHHLVPLVYGDVCLDEIRGGTITSTEKIFFFLANQLPVDRIILLGEVEGVLDTGHQIIPQITPENISHILDALGGSSGVDVTGGMETKVQDMLELARQNQNLTIRIMTGLHEGLVYQTLVGRVTPGTVISV
ncbi:MAG: isopentenyl phosphate kinase family protein [Anaerolineae bacterium]|nr:isopentenyl phosphate kinase family protein [Anaerolineae bacterium]